MLSLSGFCRSLLLREDFKPGQRSLVMSSLSGLCRSLLLREDFKPGQRSLVNVVPQWFVQVSITKGGF